MGNDSLWKAALGVPDIGAAKQSGGMSLLDPVGVANPQLQQYTDPLQILHQGGYDYAKGMSLADVQRQKEEQERAAGIMSNYRNQMANGVRLKKGGAVKSKPAKPQSKPKSGASRRGDGIAQRGKTKGRFV